MFELVFVWLPLFLRYNVCCLITGEVEATGFLLVPFNTFVHFIRTTLYNDCQENWLHFMWLGCAKVTNKWNDALTHTRCLVLLFIYIWLLTCQLRHRTSLWMSPALHTDRADNLMTRLATWWQINDEIRVRVLYSKGTDKSYIHAHTRTFR